MEDFCLTDYAKILSLYFLILLVRHVRAKLAPASCRQSRARPALAGGRDARRTAAGTAALQIIRLPCHSPRSHDPRHFFRLPALQTPERRIQNLLILPAFLSGNRERGLPLHAP